MKIKRTPTSSARWPWTEAANQLINTSRNDAITSRNDAITSLPDRWMDEADEFTRIEEFGIAEGLRIAADELTEAIRRDARQ